MDAFKLKELIEFRKNGDISKSYEIYSLLAESEELDNSLKYSLLLEAFLSGSVYDEKDAMDSIFSYFRLYNKDDKFLYLYLYYRRKQSKYYTDYDFYKNLISKDIKDLDFYGRSYSKESTDKSTKILNKALKIKKIDKREQFLLKNVEKNRHLILYKALAELYLENNNREKWISYLNIAYLSGDLDSGLKLIKYYHDTKNIDEEIKLLISSLKYNRRYSDIDNVLDVKKIIVDNNKSLEELYPFMLNLTVSESSNTFHRIMYEFANMYEYGIYHVQSDIYAYMLYTLACDYEDSLKKSQYLKDKVLNECKEKIDGPLEVIYNNVCEEVLKELEIKRQEIDELNSQYPEKELVLEEGKEDYDGTKKEEKNELYANALNAKEKYEKVEWLEKAADSGHSKAIYALYGLYKEEDPEKAYDYLLKLEGGKNPNFDKEVDFYIKMNEIKEADEEKQNAIEENKRLINQFMDVTKPYTLPRGIYPPLLIYSDYPEYKAIGLALKKENFFEIIEELENLSKKKNNEASILLARYYFYCKNEEMAEKYFIKCQKANLLKYIRDFWGENYKYDFYYSSVIGSYKPSYINSYCNEFTSKEIIEFINEMTKSSNSMEQELANLFIKRYDNCINQKNAIAKADEIGLVGVFAEVGNNGYVTKDTIKSYVEWLRKGKYANELEVRRRLVKLYRDKELCSFFHIRGDQKTINWLDTEIKAQEARLKEELIAKEKEEKRIKEAKIKALEEERIQQYLEERERLMSSPEYRKKLAEKEKQEKRLENEYIAKGEERMQQYPCPELLKWYQSGATKAKNIVKRYGMFSEKEAFNDMIERDKLLKLGFTLNEMHSDLGIFEGYKLANKVAKKQQAMAIKAEISKPSASTYQQPTPTVDKPVFQEIKNNLRIILMGYIKSDPEDPEYPNKIATRYFSAAYHTNTARSNKRHMEESYGDFNAYYVESLVINGKKVNSHPFAHHLNLTVLPGVYDIEMTIVVKKFFSGYTPSKYRSSNSEYWPDKMPKNKWARYRKTLTKQVVINPGKVWNVVCFVDLYGKWYRIYDKHYGTYEGKEFKEAATEFTLIKVTPETIKKESYRGGLYYQLNEEDFISLEDIGKEEYDPFSY